MTDAKHTPGEWTMHPEDLRGGKYWVVTIPDCETIDLHDDDNGEANACLIAAAPEMLEANIAAFYEIAGLNLAHDVEQNGWRWPDHAPQHVHPVAEKLRSAISKAEGRS